MWTRFKVFIEFITVFLLFYGLVFFGCEEARGILVPQPGIEPTPHVLQNLVSTTGLPRKSRE